MSIEDKINKITDGYPNYLSIDFNEHWSLYQPIEAYLAENSGDDDFISADDKKRIIDTNHCWQVIYYPRTPVGFQRIYASSLDAALDAMIELLC